jgi:hypothetical protein
MINKPLSEDAQQGRKHEQSPVDDSAPHKKFLKHVNTHIPPPAFLCSKNPLLQTEKQQKQRTI